MATRRELCQAEEAGWIELHPLVDAIPTALMEEPGFTEAWSAKDLLAHLAGWQAEAVSVFERMRVGTFVSERLDIDAMNDVFVEANRPIPAIAVLAQAWAARTRMLHEFDLLSEVTPDAEEWFAECGANHYHEHVGRLREWVEELRSRS